MFETQLLIAGADCAAGGQRTFERLNPVSGEIATLAAGAAGEPIANLRWVTIQTAHRHYPI